MSWFITNVIGTLLLPPLDLLLLAVVGLVLWHKRPLIARGLLTISIFLLWLLSTPFFAELLLHTLEGQPYVNDTRKPMAQAIVVLGGGTYFQAPEYGGDTLSNMTLERVRYAAKFQRETGLPLLVSGGKPQGNVISEAEQMQQVLEKEFIVPVHWLEGRSDNTLENARFSYAMLQAENITRIYLITHAWHMPRAIQEYQRAGFQVIPAPTAYTTRYQLDLQAFLPSANALRDSRIFMHELLGMFWYQLKSTH